MSAQIETIILGFMLSNKTAREEAVEKLSPPDFLTPKNRAVFSSICMLYNQGKDASPEDVFSAWYAFDKQEADLGYLYGLSMNISTHARDISSHVDILKKASLYRQIQSLLSIHNKSVEEQKADPETIVQQIQSDLDTLMKVKTSNELSMVDLLNGKDYYDSGKDYLEYMEDLMNNPRRRNCTGLETGYPELDLALDGLNKGHFIIIGARPGIGKTTFCLNLMNNIAVRRGHPVGFFSLEMKKEEYLHNSICSLMGLPSKPTRQHGPATFEQFERMQEAKKMMLDANIIFDESSPLSISQLCARARRWVNNLGVKAIFIDYLGDISPDPNLRFSNRQEAVQDVSKKLRALAKNLKVPIVCVAQLNRELDKSVSRPPIKADLRESGQIEADAHAILLLHRQEAEERDERIESDHMRKVQTMQNPERFTGAYKDKLKDQSLHPAPSFNHIKAKGNLEIHIVKNRFGQECVLQFMFKKETGELYSLDYRN